MLYFSSNHRHPNTIYYLHITVSRWYIRMPYFIKTFINHTLSKTLQNHRTLSYKQSEFRLDRPLYRRANSKEKKKYQKNNTRCCFCRNRGWQEMRIINSASPRLFLDFFVLKRFEFVWYVSFVLCNCIANVRCHFIVVYHEMFDLIVSVLCWIRKIFFDAAYSSNIKEEDIWFYISVIIAIKTEGYSAADVVEIYISVIYLYYTILYNFKFVST